MRVFLDLTLRDRGTRLEERSSWCWRWTLSGWTPHSWEQVYINILTPVWIILKIYLGKWQRRNMMTMQTRTLARLTSLWELLFLLDLTWTNLNIIPIRSDLDGYFINRNILENSFCCLIPLKLIKFVQLKINWESNLMLIKMIWQSNCCRESLLVKRCAVHITHFIPRNMAMLK